MDTASPVPAGDSKPAESTPSTTPPAINTHPPESSSTAPSGSDQAREGKHKQKQEDHDSDDDSDFDELDGMALPFSSASNQLINHA